MRSKKIYLILVMLICLYSSLLSQGVDTNQTVSSGMSILGCTTLAIQNVTVASSGNLSLSAPAEVTINGPFEVKSGGVLNMQLSQQIIFNYIYDASGNRTTRRFSSVTSSFSSATSTFQEETIVIDKE